MKEAETLASLPENYIAKIRLMAANYRISVEDTPFVYKLIQDCNEALEIKQANLLKWYDIEDIEGTFI